MNGMNFDQFAIMYLLKIKGVVAKNKKLEFNQSLNLLINQFPPKWHKVYVANDIVNDELYYFNSVWETMDELQDFLADEKYKVLKGAFKVLGSDHDVSISEVKSIKEVK